MQLGDLPRVWAGGSQTETHSAQEGMPSGEEVRMSYEEIVKAIENVPETGARCRIACCSKLATERR